MQLRQEKFLMPNKKSCLEIQLEIERAQDKLSRIKHIVRRNGCALQYVKNQTPRDMSSGCSTRRIRTSVCKKSNPRDMSSGCSTRRIRN